MYNWWLEASSWQCTQSCIMSHAEVVLVFLFVCFGETSNHPGDTSNHPGDSVPLQPRFGALWLLAFPETKITFEREEISAHRWDSGKYDGEADGDSNKGFYSVLNSERDTGRSVCQLWRGMRHHFPMYNVSCILYLLQSMSIFPITWLDNFWMDLIHIIFVFVWHILLSVMPLRSIHVVVHSNISFSFMCE